MNIEEKKKLHTNLKRHLKYDLCLSLSRRLTRKLFCEKGGFNNKMLLSQYNDLINLMLVAEKTSLSLIDVIKYSYFQPSLKIFSNKLNAHIHLSKLIAGSELQYFRTVCPDITNFSLCLTNLKELTILTITLNPFLIGDLAVNTVIAAISQMTQLTELNLTFHYVLHLNKTDPGLSKALTNLKNLNSFVLFITDIEDKEADSVSSALLNMINLTKLCISSRRGNSIFKEEAQFFSNTIKTLINLNDLSINFYDPKAINSSSFSELINLKSLTIDLLNKNIRDNEALLISLIFDRLYGLENLSLNLRMNHLTDTGVEILSNGFNKLVKLNCLELSLVQNKINDPGAIFLAIAIKKMENLRKLILKIGNNFIRDEGSNSLSKAINSLINLNYLDYSIKCSNSTPGICLFSLTEDLPMLSILILHISSNNMRDEGIEMLCDSLIHLPKLIKLDLLLSNNYLKDNGIEILSLCLSKLIQLSSLTLDLDFNNFGAFGVEILLNSISRLNHLKNTKIIFRGVLKDMIDKNLLNQFEEKIKFNC